VASLTGEFCVSLLQREIRVLAVIESGLLPIIRRMTGGAFRAQATLVHIVDPVTSDANLVQLFRIDITLMTILTFQAGVLAFKGEFRVLAVVEADFAPVLRCMAALAFLAISPFVFVIRAMTGDTGFGQILFVQIARVTGVTANRLMLAG